MSVGVVEDKQRVAFERLVTHEIPALAGAKSCKIGENHFVDFKIIPITKDKLVSEDNTEYLPVKTECSLKNTLTRENVKFNIDLLNLPVFQNLGFKIHGNYMQTLDLYERTPGWCFTAKKPNTSATEISATLLSLNGTTFNFLYDSKKIALVHFKTSGKIKDKFDISVSTFFRAITGYSNEELLSVFGYDNPFILTAFSDNKRALPESAKYSLVNRNDCIIATANAMLGKEMASQISSVSLKQREITNRLYSASYMSFGSSNALRLEYTQSYRYRAINKTLAEDISVCGVTYKEGTILDNELLTILDSSPVTSLKVIHVGKIYDLKKFSTFTFRALGYELKQDVDEVGLTYGTVLTLDDLTRLNRSKVATICVAERDSQRKIELSRSLSANVITQEDLFTAFSIWMDNLNGFDTYDHQYELTNRVIVPYDKEVLNIITSHFDSITDTLTEKIRLGDNTDDLLGAVSDFSKQIDLNKFINKIILTESKSGQMSDMCNVLAFTSKDYKVTSTIKAGNVTPDLVSIQDLQEGRLDAFDVPESDKIGIVHHRSILSEVDDNGYSTTPFLQIKDGEVVSTNPVYLSATEEADKFVAAWNETFVNKDGSKKDTVRARCNGDITSVKINRVSLKEYSPYQAMSPAHATIPFPGHSNGKRITMGCNQPKQAMPLVKRERPLTNAGGESLVDFGTYMASTVLHDFYRNLSSVYPDIERYKEEIITSDLKLCGIESGNSNRTVSFSVLAIEKLNQKLGTLYNNVARLTYPYLLKNFETGMFSYDLQHRPDGIYHCQDVIAYNNGYSLDNREHVELMDTGTQVIDSHVFDKGMALVKNLVVGYKTWMGSTIDDAITISSRLCYDDELTSISLITVSDTLYSTSDKVEEFASSESSSSYFDFNGLPVKGTVLYPGDPVISKVVRSAGKVTTKYKYLNMYTSGQVVSATIINKDNDTIAEVILASRSPIEVGDKLSGRCGNKGVIARIVPFEQMPVIPKTGEILDIVLNPLGVPSRQNITQLLIVALSMCMKMDNTMAFVSPYHPEDLNFVKEQIASHDLHPERLIDGRTGQLFEREINYGVISMYKLHHMVRKKVHAIGFDTAVDPVFLQPRKGSKLEGGQSFGEMESWCLEGIGATQVLQDLFSIQSDDIQTKEQVRKALENSETIDDLTGDNHNDLAMQACYRSLGVEFHSDVDAGEYEFTPLTDEVIRSFSIKPVTDEKALHSVTIFGQCDNVIGKFNSRERWGWLDLKTKVVNPLWIEKGSLNYLVTVATLDGVTFATTTDLKNIISGQYYVLADTACCENIQIFVASEDVSKKFPPLMDVKTQDATKLLTGIQALVWVFEHVDTTIAEELALTELNAKKAKVRFESERSSATYLKAVRLYNLIHEFNRAKFKLGDYVTTSFPVMPQVYRPLLVGSGMQLIPDFDWHYMQILRASKIAEAEPNVSNLCTLYDRIRIFQGLGRIDSRKDQKYQNILNYFAGKDKDRNHGKIRTAMQSKRILASGRSSIIPAIDTTMPPTQLGVPVTMLVKLYESNLIGYFKSKVQAKIAVSKSIWQQVLLSLALEEKNRFSEIYNKWLQAYYSVPVENAFINMKQWIVDYVEALDPNLEKQVVLAGRQPSLHKYSIRAYNPVVVYTKAIQIHPLVCKGYNADFDGDQMWVAAMFRKVAKEEAMALMSPIQDFINPKNSQVMLEHGQDMVLGIYCATMLKNNVTTANFTGADAKHYNDCETLKLDIEAGLIKTYDLVCYKTGDAKYLSTAGRILFHDCIPDGFTSNEFSNPLQITGIRPARFSDLRYDGLITAGKGGKSEIVYFNLQDICMQMYLEHAEDCIQWYQALTEFGFYMSDKFGVSLSLEDLELSSDKDTILHEKNSFKLQIEQDFQDGLIAAEDKVAAIKSLYTDKTDGANGRIQKNLLANLSRNNNLFIMMDSGARGNATQLMHMCGAIGVLQKTKTEDLEDSVTKNYYEGLDAFDVHMASYSSRLGVASTQNETKKSGYATRQVVYMTGGVKIVEEDCGKSNWWFDVVWEDHIDSKDRLIPSAEWFNRNLLGKILDTSYEDECAVFCTQEDGVIQPDSLHSLQLNGGFHSVHFTDSTSIVISMSMLEGCLLSEEDAMANLYLSRIIRNRKLTKKCIRILEKKFIKQVGTNLGIFTFRYTMAKCCSSVLLSREARNLKYLNLAYDRTYGKKIHVITKKTLGYIEDAGLERIEARILLDCEAKHGLCAHCYGLKYSNLQLPEIGSFVGIEAAQSAGEPAAQLTMSLINKGGVAGESIASGVQIFENLLTGGTKNAGSSALAAQNNGYVHINKIDETVSVSIVPADKSCELCHKCMSIFKCSGCPREQNTEQKMDPLCLVPMRLRSNMLLPEEGEWLYSGDYLTDNILVPNNISSILLLPDEITSVQDVRNPQIILRKKQMIWLMNYFNTFLSNNITINARHFEILARIQNQYVTITDSSLPEFIEGSVHEINEVLPHLGQVKIHMETSKRGDVILRNSGAFTALSFENLPATAAKLAIRGYHSSFKDNNALIGMISVGTDLTKNKMKEFCHPNDFTLDKEVVSAVDNAPKLVEVILPTYEVQDLQDISLAELLSFDESLKIKQDTVEVASIEQISGTDSVNLGVLNAFGSDIAVELTASIESVDNTVGEVPCDLLDVFLEEVLDEVDGGEEYSEPVHQGDSFQKPLDEEDFLYNLIEEKIESPLEKVIELTSF